MRLSTFLSRSYTFYNVDRTLGGRRSVEKHAISLFSRGPCATFCSLARWIWIVRVVSFHQRLVQSRTQVRGVSECEKNKDSISESTFAVRFRAVTGLLFAPTLPALRTTAKTKNLYVLPCCPPHRSSPRYDFRSLQPKFSLETSDFGRLLERSIRLACESSSLAMRRLSSS